MPKYKANFSQKDERIAQVLAALAHPCRVAIVKRLSGNYYRRNVKDSGEVRPTIAELGKGLEISAPTLTHHIKELKKAGIIQTIRAGQYQEVELHTEVLAEVMMFMLTLGSPISTGTNE